MSHCFSILIQVRMWFFFQFFLHFKWFREKLMIYKKTKFNKVKKPLRNGFRQPKRVYLLSSHKYFWNGIVWESKTDPKSAVSFMSRWNVFRSFNRGIMSLCRSKCFKLSVCQVLRMIPLSRNRSQNACTQCTMSQAADFFRSLTTLQSIKLQRLAAPL